MNTKLNVVLATTLLIVSAVAAQAAPDLSGNELIIHLDPTTMGEGDYSATGIVKRAVRGDLERFVLRIVANCKDGTIFVVRVTNAEGKEFDAGAITMLFDSGSLVLKNSEDLSTTFPTGMVSGIAVYEQRGAILKGEITR